VALKRLVKGAQAERIAIMCAEGEPLDCHRTVLVARVLTEHGVTIDHIHGDGRIESRQPRSPLPTRATGRRTSRRTS
jgi:hypothetical protein